ncbi:MAG: hypothetical protein A3A58_00145 [Candidatus Blackburnbacteria bacterium RIFCSPLOWO2_01_FULL_41_27]|uniref:Membrane protein 6-pyruvoyl-tetrahydropterin synthase-related domain-containing protein n=2 Tax=Candidatus Blackburniibacteriota TaxID=1817898 RepID=A0A1G1VCB8_9BACT|nr:MAG: hypothetical protein A3A58_00145 [Candidatus Blackburnbacteria bacterium RIFCSPLOWO2_01_FULL_41_27]OGY12976.1 MAG: hypothetical protein A3F61_00975 [Candidatus Blackburnbacteria bacterium RIFCSPHIGHO2_12_FULL_41_13b]
MKKTFLGILSNFWPHLLIILVTCLFFYQVFLGKIPISGDVMVGGYLPWLDYKWGYSTGVPVKNPITSDTISLIFPLRELAVSYIKTGVWPLWNPYLLAGVPLLADFQSAPFSPTNIVYFFTSMINGWTLQVIAQHILAAYFTYLLARYWKISRLGSVVAGLAYAFSGYNILMSSWNVHVLVGAFIPLILLLADKWFKEGKMLSLVFLSLSVALDYFSGYPQLVFYMLLSLFLLCIWHLRITREYFVKVILLGLFVVLGFLLTAIQLFPAVELILSSQRGVESIPAKWIYLVWQELITFFAPDYYGNHATANYWGYKNYMSNLGFMSVAGFVLATISLNLWQKVREIKFLVLLVVFSLLLAFPTPLAIFVSETGLLGSKAMVSYRVLIIYALAVSLAIGYGLDYWLKNGKRVNLVKPIILPGAVLLGFGIYTALSYFGGASEEIWKHKVSLRNLILPSLSLLAAFVSFVCAKYFKSLSKISVFVVILAMFVELFYFGWKFTPFTRSDLVYPETPITNYLENFQEPSRVNGFDGIMPVNMGMPYRIEFSGGYEPIYPLNTAKYIAVLNSNNIGVTPQDRFGIIDRMSSPLSDLLNTEYFLVKTDSLNFLLKEQKGNEYLEHVFTDKSVSILKNKNALPRAAMFFDWQTLPKEEHLGLLIDPKFSYKEKLLIEEEIKFTKQPKSDWKVEFTKYASLETILKVTTKTDGLLFVSDTMFPGWKAFRGNEEIKIYLADHMFRAVEVPKGEWEIRFVYKPESFFLGIKVTLASLFILVILALYFKKGKPKL